MSSSAARSIRQYTGSRSDSRNAFTAILNKLRMSFPGFRPAASERYVCRRSDADYLTSTGAASAGASAAAGAGCSAAGVSEAADSSCFGAAGRLTGR